MAKQDQKLDRILAMLAELQEQVSVIRSITSELKPSPKETDNLGELKPVAPAQEPSPPTPAPPEAGTGPLEKKPWSAIPSPRTETEPKKEPQPLPPAGVYDPFKEKEP